MIEWLRSDHVKVSCQGDIEVLDFAPDENGVAWVLLRQREKGKIGRVAKIRPVVLAETDGVTVGMMDARSARVLEHAFRRVAEALEAK